MKWFLPASRADEPAPDRCASCDGQLEPAHPRGAPPSHPPEDGGDDLL